MFERKNNPSVGVCSMSSLSLTHLHITPCSPRLYLNFSLLHSPEQAATDVVQIPACGAIERRAAVCSDVEGQRESWWEARRLPRLPKAGSRTRRGRDEGDVAVESPGGGDGFREAAWEQEGVRHRSWRCKEKSAQHDRLLIYSH